MPTVTEEDLQALGEDLLAKIGRAAAAGTLGDAPFYYDIVSAWSHLGKVAEAKAWLSAGMMDSAQFLARATLGLVSHSLSTRERVYSLRERPDESLYDLQVLKDASQKHLASSELDTDQRNRITVVAEGIERIMESDAVKTSASLEKADDRGP
jgi:hypothetical protein